MYLIKVLKVLSCVGKTYMLRQLRQSSVFVVLILLVDVTYGQYVDAKAQSRAADTRQNLSQDEQNQRLSADPQFQSGRRKSIAGILVTSIGGGIGGWMTVAGLLGQANKIYYAGLGTVALSAGVGVPLMIYGEKAENRAITRLLSSSDSETLKLTVAMLPNFSPSLGLSLDF